MSRDHWDAILASAPLNATAAAVTSKGYAYEPSIVPTEKSWDGPPPIRGPLKQHLANPSFIDFTGKRYGRLVVLGMLAEKAESDDNGAIWVCRCSCGRYVGRRAKAIKTANPEARCELCHHAMLLSRAASGNNARERAESPKARKW